MSGGEQRQVEDLGDAPACEAEPAGDVGAVADRALLDERLDMVCGGEELGQLRGTA
jgi:hypothetical protein